MNAKVWVLILMMDGHYSGGVPTPVYTFDNEEQCETAGEHWLDGRNSKSWGSRGDMRYFHCLPVPRKEAR